MRVTREDAGCHLCRGDPGRHRAAEAEQLKWEACEARLVAQLEGIIGAVGIANAAKRGRNTDAHANAGGNCLT